MVNAWRDVWITSIGTNVYPTSWGSVGKALDVKVDGYLPICDANPGVNLFNGDEEMKILVTIGKRLHCAPQVSRALDMSQNGYGHGL